MAAHLDGSAQLPYRPFALAFAVALAGLAEAFEATVQPLRAQAAQRVIAGTILDVRDNPVPFGSVTMNGGKATATADDSGRFRLVIPHRDRVVFDVRRLGYMPSRIALVAGGDTTVSVLLLPAATKLPAVEVKDAAIRSPGIAGFEQRMIERKRGAGAGWFITAKEIEASSPLRATQVVEAIPSVNVRRVSGDRFAIFGRSGLGQDCPATVYLDAADDDAELAVARDRRGRAVGVKSNEGAPIDMLVEPSEIAGVEVYQRGMFAPNQLQPNDPTAMRCAIVAFWTKHAS